MSDSTNGNNRSWLDERADLVSDIDPLSLTQPALDLSTFLGNGFLEAVIQKPRVTNLSPTTLYTNPIRQTNAYLGVTQGPLFEGSNAPLSAAPRVSVTVPFGLPVGTYSDLVQIIESDNLNNDPQQIIPGDGSIHLGDPSFTLVFHVQETGITNRVSAPLDTLLDTYAGTSATNLYANVQPAGYRDQFGLHMVFSLTRPSFTPAAPPVGSSQSSPYSLFATSLASNSGATVGQNPLSDLDAFTTAAGSMFSHDVGLFPSAAPASLFIPPGLAGYTMNASFPTQYTSPAFPNSPNNPYSPSAALNSVPPYLVFLGQAQILNSANAAFAESEVMISPSTIGGSGVSLGNVAVLPDSISQPSSFTSTVKGRPTIVQANQDATVFYSASGANHGALYAATYNGTAWLTNNPISLPADFEAVAEPDANGRVYSGRTVTGANGVPLISNGQPLLELSFQGKMTGRQHPDIYMMRLPSDTNGVPQSYSPMDMLPISNEPLTSAKNGLYDAQGVAWDTNQPLWVTLYYGANATSFVLSPSVATLYQNPVGTVVSPPVNVDSQTGTISFDAGAGMGGKVYVNPTTGTVQFSTPPPATTTVGLTYTPRIVRVSSGASSDSYPTILFDDRSLAGSNLTNWFTGSGPSTQPVSQTPSPAVRADRTLFTYGGLSVGTGHAAQPFLSTYRFGVVLPTQVATSGASIISFQVTNNTGSYCQVDPANGVVYFTAVDEGSVVSFSYTGLDVNGNQIPVTVTNAMVTMIPEQAENPIPITGGAVDEAQITSFLDPFDVPPSGSAAGRPGLIWLFWTSTRKGAPDVFFETIAPNFASTTSSR